MIHSESTKNILQLVFLQMFQTRVLGHNVCLNSNRVDLAIRLILFYMFFFIWRFTPDTHPNTKHEHMQL